MVSQLSLVVESTQINILSMCNLLLKIVSLLDNCKMFRVFGIFESILLGVRPDQQKSQVQSLSEEKEKFHREKDNCSHSRKLSYKCISKSTIVCL